MNTDITKALGLAEILASLAAGASPEARTRATAQRLLDATWSLAQRAQRYHWNVTGPTFSELHELFGEQYDEANEAVDEIAERMRALGVADVRPRGTPAGEPYTVEATANEQLRALRGAHREAARLANELASAAERSSDAGTVDLAGRRALAHEKAAWMLSATMGPDAIEKAHPLTPAEHQQRVDAARKRIAHALIHTHDVHHHVAHKIAEGMAALGDHDSCDAMRGKCMKHSDRLAQHVHGTTYKDDYGDDVKVEAWTGQLWDAPNAVKDNPLAHGHYVTKIKAGDHHFTIDPTAAQFPELGHRGPAIADSHDPKWSHFEPIDAVTKAKRKPPAAPFIGPKGGKWADAAHTIPWRPPGTSTMVLHHGNHHGRNDWEPHTGACLTPRESSAQVYATRRGTMHDVHLDTSNLRVTHLDSDGYDHDGNSAPGDSEADLARHAKDSDIIVYDDEDETGRSHETYRLVTPAAVEAARVASRKKWDDDEDEWVERDPVEKARRKPPAAPFIGPHGGKWANESHTRHWSSVDNHDPRAKADYYAKLRRTQTANAKGQIYTLTKWAGDPPERVEVAHHPDSGRVHLRFAGRAATHSSHDPADLLITPDAVIHRTAGVLAKRDAAPEPRLAPLTEPIAKGGSLAALLGTFAGYEIPEFMAHALARNIAKAAHHKYLRRVLTGKAKPRYRYYYTVTGGKGIGHHDEFAVGAAFRMKDSGKNGHFEVKEDHGDGHVTIRHDESGTEHKVHKDALAGMLRSEHAEAIQSAADKAKAAALKTLAEARESGSDKHVERAKAEATKRGASEDETATPEERQAKEAKPEPKAAEKPKPEPKGDKPRGPTGEHQRVGSHVAGARRDIAGLSREQLADLAPNEAKKLVVKSKIHPFPSETEAREEGWSPGAYALWKHLYNTIATEAPEPGWNMRNRISPEQFATEMKRNRQEFVDAIDYFAKRFAVARGSAADMLAAIKESGDLWNRGRSAGTIDGRTFSVGRGRHEAAMKAYESPDARRAQVLGERFVDALENMAAQQFWIKDTHRKAIKAATVADQQGWTDAAGATNPKASGKPKADPYVFKRAVEDMPSRVGGRPIDAASADALRNEFGLHEVDFGHWVSQGDREHHVKWAHSALRDLEDVIGIPSGMAALPQVTKRSGRNTLALAFGARGKGRALAHYEPFAHDEKTKVLTPTINLTRFGGGGTLAHEWGHFLDNVLAHAHHTGPDKGDALFLSEGHSVKGLPDDVKAPVEKLRSLLASSSFAKHGKALGAYWGRPHELFARAFEAYVQDKLAGSGRRNSYLVDGTTDRSPSNKSVRPDTTDLRAVDHEVDTLRERLESLRRDSLQSRNRDPEARKELARVEAEYDAKHREAMNKHFGSGLQNAQPYPHAVERKKFAAAFDDLFAALRKGQHLEKALRSILEAAAIRKALRIR